MPIPAGGGGPLVSVDEFGVYLNNPSLDVARATLILSLAQTLCESVVKPLPDGADIVILDVAERAYANPSPTSDQSVGLYEEGLGPFSTSTPGISGGGLFLTQNNQQTLRSLAGRGGAFMIDTIPATLAPSLPWWDTNGVNVVGDWDSPT